MNMMIIACVTCIDIEKEKLTGLLRLHFYFCRNREIKQTELIRRKTKSTSLIILIKDNESCQACVLLDTCHFQVPFKFFE